MAYCDSNGNVVSVTCRIVRVDVSPMNPRVKCYQLDCGHEVFLPIEPGRRARVGGLLECERCLAERRKAQV